MSGNTKDFKVKSGIQPTVYHESVGTVVSGSEPYSLASASYDGVNFVTGVVNMRGPVFKPDGTKMYLSAGAATNAVTEFNLSIAWDISTASLSQSFSVSAQEENATGMFFKPDGTKFYVTGQSGSDVNEYTLSTAWDISTASYAQSFSVSSQDSGPYALFFKPDGTKMYVLGISNDSVFQYSLSTAWDVSTASYDSVNFSVATQEILPTGLFFTPDGASLFIVGQVGDNVVKYNMSTAWDISTASLSETFSILSEDGSSRGVAFKPDGTKMYISGITSNTVHQYSPVLTTNTLDLSSGSVFEITPTSDIQVTLSNPAASGTSSGATLLLSAVGTKGFQFDVASYDNVSLYVGGQELNPDGIAFNSDNTKLFVAGLSSDAVHQYNLSMASDISTATYSGTSFSFTHPSANTRHIVFNNDGTKLFVMDGNDSAYQYSLSTAFDISTLSYDSVSFSFTSQDSSPTAIRFNNDGTKMYMSGTAADRIYQYSLSTAFNIGTASYDSLSLLVSGQVNSPNDLYFNADGSKLFVIGENTDGIYQYNLSTPFAINTGSYSGTTLSLSAQETSPFALAFNSDGTKMYYAGRTNDTVYQYSTATPATITYDTSIEWPGGTAPTSPAIGETDVITFNTTDGGISYKAVVAIDGAS